MKHLAALALTSIASIFSISACGSTAGSTDVACRPLSSTPTARRSAQMGGSVFTIVMENHSYADVIGSANAPYINSLLPTSAVAAGYHDSYVHPSEPNYIWMVAGQNFGVLNDQDPGPPTNIIESKSHFADQLEARGLTWKSYQQSMGQPCGLVSHGNYAVKHNPFAYFADINGWDGTTFQPSARCDQHIVDYSQLAADLASGQVPDYVFITPDLEHDMHNGSEAAADTWLSQELPKIMASDAYRRGGVIFLTWDEGTFQKDDPPFIVISPLAKPGFVSQTDYDTSSFLKTVQAILGVEALPCAQTPDAVSTMDDLFTVPVSANAPVTDAGPTP
jgi:phosphatidylinositol-3-phosphatase